MTVDELLKRILAAYPGASPEAMATYKAVFYARFKHREGDHLQAAADEVLATFRPKYDQKFPIPADFEGHMPKLHLVAAGEGGGAIRAELEARDHRARRLFNEWHMRQGTKLKDARPHPVYAACLLMALELCGSVSNDDARVILTAEQIKLCEERALSQARLRLYGPLPASNEAWDAQIEQVRQGWANPRADVA